MYNALGHAPAKRLPGNYQNDPGLGQLSRLFEAVAKKQPEIVSARQAVEEGDRLRMVRRLEPQLTMDSHGKPDGTAS